MKTGKKEGEDILERGTMPKVKLVKTTQEISLANVKLMRAINLKNDMERDISTYLSDARSHFLTALTLPGEHAEPYYGLFKIAVLEGNYLEAYKQLQKYQLKVGENSNFSLINQMLLTLLGKKGEKQNGDENYIQEVKVDCYPLIWNYRLAETAFDECDYQKVVKHLSICERLASKKEIDLDIPIMLHLANTILALCKEKQKKKLQSLFSNSKAAGERMVIAHRLMELDDRDFENNFMYMDAYIDLKAYSPLTECINKLKSLSSTEEEDATLSLYERLMSEILIESKNLKDIQNALRHGNILEQEALYREAIASYEGKRQETNLPYFQVLEARCYYALGDLDNAILCCNSYLDSGYLHYVDASLLLYRIYRDKNEVEKAFEVAFECYQKARMKTRGFTLKEWILHLNNEYIGEEKGEENPVQKQYLSQAAEQK